MSALSSAELRRRADAVDKLGKSWAVRMEPDEARALADELDRDQEALKVAEEALYRLTNEVACLYAFEEAVRALIGNTNWNVLMCKRDDAITALAQIRARRKG